MTKTLSKNLTKTDKFTDHEWELLKKYAPCLVFDDKEPFKPLMVGCTIHYCNHHPPSLDTYYKRYYPLAQFIDILRCIVITIVYERPFPEVSKFIVNRFQPVLMTIRDGLKITHAARVLEYALYYYTDIQHVYEMEHCWMYLDGNDQLIGAKGTRHGVYMTLYPNAKSIKYHKEHPILYVSPGKHEMGSDVSMFNFQILDAACSIGAGRVGVYRFYFAPREELLPIAKLKIRKKIDKLYIIQQFQKKYAFHPALHWKKCRIMTPYLAPWEVLAKKVPQYVYEFLDQL
jgi:hypothetical protein